MVIIQSNMVLSFIKTDFLKTRLWEEVLTLTYQNKHYGSINNKEKGRSRFYNEPENQVSRIRPIRFIFYSLLNCTQGGKRMLGSPCLYRCGTYSRQGRI